MKRFIKLLLVLILFIPIMLFAEEKTINMYLFYGDGCPHCKELEEFLGPYLKENKDIKLYKYELWYNEENVKLYEEVHNLLNDKSSGIPYLVIGTTSSTGFYKESTPNTIINTVNFYRNTKYKDTVGIFLGVSEEEEETEEIEYEEKEKDIPIIGKKDVTSFPLIASAIIIGLVDGFNPCAMWILIFLISMLLGLKDKKRRYALGISFLGASALVYFLFLISWLNLAVYLNKLVYIRVDIAAIAIIFGVISISRFTKSLFQDDGCEVVDSTNRKRIINAIKKIVKEKSFFLALLGVVLLAFGVNVIELLCSLGLPVMFSEILALNEVGNTMKIVYSLIYVFFFLIDDIIIFVIAMKTLEIKAISNKFGKYAHLIGGIIMLLIGFLMVYKPEWLMFNF